jgi:anti-sigma factor ChrR (cupin superfamily)
MKLRHAISLGGPALVLLAGLRVDLGATGFVRLDSAAHAWVGAPATPASYAGVARRTARRTTAVVAGSASASAAASQQQAAAAQQQAAAAQQEAAAAQQQAAASRLPLGTTVSALPSGCTTINISGADYFDCGGTYYRTAFQSGNVVYVVSQP